MPNPQSWSDVLAAEYAALHGAPPPELTGDEAARETQVYAAIHRQPTTAVCFSGGGIRSGTFALGVLQGLAHIGVLGKFDYLSTVSGGGYTGGWFTAWLHRKGAAQRNQILRALDPAQSTAETGCIDPPPVDYVRRMCRYLAPTGGRTSADFWTLLATLVRNLTLNWLVILPLVSAALLLPRLFYTITRAFDAPLGSHHGFQCLATSPASSVFLTIALGGFGIAIGYVAAVFSGVGRNWSQPRFLAWFLLPLIVGAVGCAMFWAAFPCNLSSPLMLGLSAGLPAAGWIVVGIWSRRRGDRSPEARTNPRFIGPRTIFAAAVSGLILGGGAYWFATFEYGFGDSEAAELQYAALAVPLVLGLVLLTITAFVGLASQELDDGSLEWWSRCAAWIGLAAAFWLTASALVLYMADGLDAAIGALEGALNMQRRSLTTTVSALLPLLASLAGMAARSTGATGQPSAIRVILQKFGLPIVIVALLTTVAWVNLRAAEAIEYHLDAAGVRCTATSVIGSGACHALGAGFGEVLILLLVMLAVGLTMSYFVEANRFSLHGMYRERLVRTFLGASRDDRSPNGFTGFDAGDDLRVHDLADVRPLHVMNATLNAVSSTKVGRHERQAQSFTFSPLHVGNRETGYRLAREYGSDGGGPGTGLSLGMAMAVSGAAASSAMGIYSSKARAFLLTLANARLGLWFGNPSDDTSWQNSEPPLGVTPILRELLGLTTDSNPYVYLSDGGHYENLGLWEMVARRCAFIVVSDAGCDPEYGFGDLSNAVRRIRLDLGIPIEFAPLDITKAGQGRGNPHVAVGTIRYSVVDGAGAPPGTILYLKATLSGDEPVDVWNFARNDPAFPHDSTGDQFFDEARFESYRNLGFHTVITAAPGFAPGGGVKQWIDAAREGLERRVVTP